MDVLIRRETAADLDGVRHANRLAFGQDDEARLVDALRDGGHARLSLVAEKDHRVVGHVLFSDLPIVTQAGTVPALALAPLAVLPECQNRGVGSALVRRGLEVCKEEGHRVVVVVGHPRFYRRFGFSSELAARLESPFSAGESFMAVELAPGALAEVAGRVVYPPPFEPAQEVHRMALLVLDGAFAVCRLPNTSSLPPWAAAGGFFSMTRTADELSVVCAEAAVPEGVRCEHGWRCLRVAGTIDFSVVGVLAALTAALAGAGVSVFAISTFDTDYLLVKDNDLAAALAAFRRAGHVVQGGA
jgi:putative acetyltransferase